MSALLPLAHRAACPHPAAPLDLAAHVGAAGWARLPTAVQRRFGAAHADTTYRGTMDLHCSRIGRVLAWLAKPLRGPLTRIEACAVTTVVRVHDNGRGGVVWERSFERAGAGALGPRVVRSTKVLDADGSLRERTDGGLAMTLDVFEDHGSLVFRSRRFWWVIGGLRLPIPALFTPGVCTVTHTDLGCGRFHFSLSMRHALWGETFHQSGEFIDPHGSAARDIHASHESHA